GFIQGIFVSDDGKWITYKRRENFEDPETIRLASLSGPAPGVPRVINDPYPNPGGLSIGQFAGARVLYSARDNSLSPPAGRLYEVQLGAQAGPATPLTGWESELFYSSPDGTRVAYWRRRVESAYDWYAVGTTGSAPSTPVRLHAALTGDDSTSS